MEAETLKNCLTGVCEKLKDVRMVLQGPGRKSNDVNDYTLDGTEEYKAMATALENSIHVLEDGETPLPKVIEQLKTLKTASEHYHDERYGVFGFPIHPSGRARLLQAGDLMENLPVYISALMGCRNKLNDLMGSRNKQNDLNNTARPGDENLNLIRLYESLYSEVYKKGLEGINLDGRTFLYEIRLPAAKAKAYDKLYDYDKELHAVYVSGHYDEAMSVVKRWFTTEVAVPMRAHLFVLENRMNQILKPGVTAEEAERLLKDFTRYNCDKEERILANDEIFDYVQRVCQKREYDDGLSVWAKAEEKAEEMRTRLLNTSTVLKKSNQELSESISSTYQKVAFTNGAIPGENAEKNEKNAWDAVYKQAAVILTEKAVASPEGKRVRQMMALENNNRIANLLLEKFEKTLRDNNAFKTKKKESLVSKIKSVLDSEIHKDVLRDFYKLHIKPNVVLTGERENVNVVKNELPKNESLKNESTKNENLNHYENNMMP